MDRIQYLRDIDTFLGVKFRMETGNEGVTMTGVGIGFTNMSKKVS